jgi:hypothetical protein
MINSKTFFLFEMTTGRRKLAYGDDPADALAILALRLTPEEMSLIKTDQYTKISQLDLQKVVKDLG